MGGFPRKVAKLLKRWSGRRDSNPRRPAWEAGILPLNYSRSIHIGYLASWPLFYAANGSAINRTSKFGRGYQLPKFDKSLPSAPSEARAQAEGDDGLRSATIAAKHPKSVGVSTAISLGLARGQ